MFDVLGSRGDRHGPRRPAARDAGGPVHPLLPGDHRKSCQPRPVADPRRSAHPHHGQGERDRRGGRPRARGRGASPGVVLDLEGSLGRGSLPEGTRARSLSTSATTLDIRSAFAQAQDAVAGMVDVLVAVAGNRPRIDRDRRARPRCLQPCFRVNAHGVMRTVPETEPAMGDGGAIVVITSQNAWRGNENLASYVASKHTALGLVRSLALELGPRGIRVNAGIGRSRRTPASAPGSRPGEQAGGRTVDEALAAEGLAERRSSASRRPRTSPAQSCSSRTTCPRSPATSSPSARPSGMRATRPARARSTGHPVRAQSRPRHRRGARGARRPGHDRRRRPRPGDAIRRRLSRRADTVSPPSRSTSRTSSRCIA